MCRKKEEKLSADLLNRGREGSSTPQPVFERGELSGKELLSNRGELSGVGAGLGRRGRAGYLEGDFGTGHSRFRPENSIGAKEHKYIRLQDNKRTR